MSMRVRPPGNLQTTSDIRRLVEEVQTLYNAEFLPDEDTLTPIAGLYHQAVEYANERLEECVDPLRRGLVNDAIQLNETEPNLLQIVTLLDFAERAHLGAFFQQLGLPAPPDLKTELAAELNEAYVSAESIASLMLKHRLHALARSPLNLRIDVMRQIAKKDAGNSIWNQDLQTYETFRIHQQIPEEFQRAVRDNDEEAVEQLEQELRTSEWRVSPSKDLVRQVCEEADKMRIRRARRELRSIAEELVRAHTKGELAAGRDARVKWSSLAPAARLPADDRLLASVSESFKWLDKHDERERQDGEFAALLERIHDAIENKDGRGELQRLCKLLERFDREPPRETVEALEKRRQDIRNEETKRRRRRFVAVFAMLLAVCAASVSVALVWQRSSEIATTSAELENLLDRNEFDELERAFALLEQDTPHVFQSPQVQDIRNRWHEKLDQQKDRQERLANVLTTVRRLGLEQATLETIPEALTKLREANDEGLVVTEAEVSEVGRLFHQMEDRRSELERQVRETFIADFNALQKRRETIDSQSDGALDQLAIELRELTNRKFVADTDKKPALQLIAELAKLSEDAKRHRLEEQLLENIARAIGNYETFRTRLAEFTENPQLADTARATAFRAVLAQDAPLWPAMREWSTFLELWSGKDFTRLNGNDKKKLLDDANAVNEKCSNFNVPGIVLVDELTKIGPREGAKSAIQDILKGPVVAQWRVVRTTSDDRSKSGEPVSYYFDESCKAPVPLPALNTWQIEFLSSAIPNAGKSKKIISVINNSKLPSNGQYDWRSPQARFSEKALALLSEASSENWEPKILSILSELHYEPKIGEDEKIDPILKVTLERALLKAAADSSAILARQLKVSINVVGQADLDLTVNWVVPGDVNASAVRSSCQAVLRDPLSEPDRDGIPKAVKDKLSELSSLNLGKRLVWIAFLCRDDSGGAVLRPSSLPSSTPAGSLLVLIPGSTSEKAHLKEVGRVNNGVVSLGNGAGSEFVEGRPVFLQLP